MDGKGETGGLQRSHGAHPERTGKPKWKSNLPASRKREFSPVNEGKRETAIERLCMETASMAVFYTQDAWSYSYFISNYKSSFLLKNYFSCDR